MDPKRASAGRAPTWVARALLLVITGGVVTLLVGGVDHARGYPAYVPVFVALGGVGGLVQGIAKVGRGAAKRAYEDASPEEAARRTEHKKREARFEELEGYAGIVVALLVLAGVYTYWVSR